jgi:hypothetical protein
MAMTTENDGKQQKQQLETAQEARASQTVDGSRRRFTRIGVGASGAILTLASRSVLAQVTCKSPSGFQSGNTSSQGTQARCTGFDPAYWSTTSAAWPIAKDTKFSDVFGASGNQWINAPTAKFFDVFSDTNTNKNKDKKAKADTNTIPDTSQTATLFEVLTSSEAPEVVKRLIAAFLNARGHYNDFPTEDNVRTIYREWISTGSYEPSAAIKWGPDDIVKYLKATQGGF